MHNYILEIFRLQVFKIFSRNKKNTRIQQYIPRNILLTIYTRNILTIYARNILLTISTRNILLIYSRNI